MSARRVARLVRNLVGRRRVERQLDLEVRAYVDQLIDERVAAGVDPAEARRQALAEAGALESIKDHVRDVRAGAWIEQTWRDVRHAVRLLRRSPGFAVVALLTLAIGTGANAALFQLIDAVRLRSLPVAAPDRLVAVELANMDGARGNFQAWHPAITHPQWREIQQYREPFSGLFAWAAESYNLATGGEVRPARVLWASGEMFDTLGVAPEIGRAFGPADDRPGCGPTGVVISHGFWQREYGGGRSALGQHLTLSSHSLEIIGVMPARFFGLEIGRDFDVIVPLCAEPYVRPANSRLQAGTVWWLTAVGRLKDGWSIERASQYEADRSAAVFRASLPANYPPVSVDTYLKFQLHAASAAQGVSQVRENYSEPLILLLVLAGLLLLIACGNIANLMLAQASAREREMALRLAIGASRGRLIRQSLIQSGVLAVAGALLGVLFARELGGVLISLVSSTDNPLVIDLHLHWRVFAFTLLLASITCVAFGLAPALRATRADPASALRSAGRSVTPNKGHLRLRRTLVAAQVALSLVLLVAALLFADTFRNLLATDVGFQPKGLIVTNIGFRVLKVPLEQLPAFKKRVVERLRAMPEVSRVAEVSSVPLSGSGRGNAVWIEGTSTRKDVTIATVGDQYFTTVGTPIVAGREFDDHDRADSPAVAIVNQAFAAQFLDGQNPVGKRVRIEATPQDPERALDIVGYVKDAKYWNLREAPTPTVYISSSQELEPAPSDVFLLRSSVSPDRAMAAIKATMASIDPRIALEQGDFAEGIRESLQRERLMATLSGFFGGLAALLATIGLYGVIAYGVVQRRGEIGIRMALGASRRAVVTMVVREAGWLLAVGMAAGVVIAALTGRAATALLFDLSPWDPRTYATAIALLGLVTLCASSVPAARAARLDPTIALRE